VLYALHAKTHAGNEQAVIISLAAVAATRRIELNPLYAPLSQVAESTADRTRHDLTVYKTTHGDNTPSDAGPSR
jgi:hypothetical protein